MCRCEVHTPWVNRFPSAGGGGTLNFFVGIPVLYGRALVPVGRLAMMFLFHGFLLAITATDDPNRCIVTFWAEAEGDCKVAGNMPHSFCTLTQPK